MPSLSSSLPDPAAEAFASAALEIVERRGPKLWGAAKSRPKYSSTSEDRVHRTRAYYRDSSGRARVHLRVRLRVPDNGSGGGVGGLEALLECGCIQPVPVESEEISADEDGEEAAKEDEGDDKDEGDKKGVNGDGDEDDEMWQNELSNIGKEVGEQSPWFTDTTCTFECAIASSSDKSGSDNSSSWALEGVTIHRSKIERSSSSENPKKKPPISALVFDLEIAVRGNGVIRSNNMREMLEEGELELRAVLRQKTKHRKNDEDEAAGGANSGHGNVASKSLLGGKGGAGIAAGLLGLEYGGGSLAPSVISRGLGSSSGTAKASSKNEIEMHYGTKILRTPPLQLHATLIPPLQLTVREVCGARAASGSTLVEITVEHSSRWHRENVTVTGIAFHPGQSRLWGNNNNLDGGESENEDPADQPNKQNVSEGKSMQGGELSVIDMSRRVRWGFAPSSAPELPLVLGPYEAFATVIQIDAGEDVRSRAFLSPISVNAMIGGGSIAGIHGNKVKESLEKDGERVMVTADARWTSSRVGVENSDAFRVDMSLRGGLETICRVGAPLVVSLRVLNLSMEPRDLMLLMAKDGEGRNSGLQWERADEDRRRKAGRNRRGSVGNRERQQLLHQYSTVSQGAEKNSSFNTAVVSEVNGYTFGVWGLSGDDDGTTRHHRDHELLAVDAALLLGEVKGQHSIEAELRFVPLREGTLDVPNLKLYDKRGMKWYNCVHTLKIVARQSNV